MFHENFWRSAKEKLQPSRRRCGSLGVGSQGGAEAVAIFHQLLYDEWAEGSLTEPFARVKVDDKNCSEMIEWKAAAAAWKHRNSSHVEQDGLAPVPKDRGAEHGDVDRPLGVQPSSGNGGG